MRGRRKQMRTDVPAQIGSRRNAQSVTSSSQIGVQIGARRASRGDGIVRRSISVRPCSAA
jgi:hypothetical protein